MKKEKIYAQWKEHRRKILVPEDFAAGVMSNIENQASKEEYELPAGLTEIRHSFMKWFAAASLVLLGLFRILYITANLLRADLLMP